jgi:hypothetical protein
MDERKKDANAVVVMQKETGIEKSQGTSAVVGDLGRPASSRVLVTIKEFNNRTYVDVRTFFENEEGKLLPTTKGISLRPEKLDRLIKLLMDARIRTVGSYDAVPFDEGKGK